MLYWPDSMDHFHYVVRIPVLMGDLFFLLISPLSGKHHVYAVLLHALYTSRTPGPLDQIKVPPLKLDTGAVITEGLLVRVNTQLQESLKLSSLREKVITLLSQNVLIKAQAVRSNSDPSSSVTCRSP